MVDIDILRCCVALRLAAAMLVVFTAVLLGSARAQATPPERPPLDSVIFVPKTGAPLASPILVKLPKPVAAGETLSAAVVPGSLSPVMPTCPLSLTATVGGAAPGSDTAAVTLGAPALACGGGRYSLTLRLTLHGGSEDASQRILADFPVSLQVRFEPSVEVRSGNTQTVSLQGVTCWLCWLSLPPILTDTLLPQIESGPQAVEVQNTSIGRIRVQPMLDAVAGAPTGLELQSSNAQEIPPGGTARLGIKIKPQDAVRAGEHDRRLLLAVAEAGVAAGAAELSRSIPIRLNLRIGVIWAFFALLVGFLLGRSISLLQDPAYAAKLAFFDRLRKVKYLAMHLGKWDGEGGVKDQLENIAAALEFSEGVPDDLKLKLTKVEDTLSPTPQLSALQNGGAPPAAPPTLRVRVFRWVSGWVFGSSQPPLDIGADLIRPLVQLAIIFVGFSTGLKLFYLDAPAFGANGVLDLMPLVVWSATTMAVAKSLEAFKRLDGR